MSGKVTVEEYVNQFWFKYLSYGYGRTILANAETGAEALLAMLKLVWQKGGKDDMHTAFFCFKEQLVAARATLPALQQQRVDAIFTLLECLLDAAEKLRQFSPIKETLSAAVLQESRARLHRILVGDAFAGDLHIRRRALEICYRSLVREQADLARSMQRQLQVTGSLLDAKQGRAKPGAGLLKAAMGPDFTSWQGLWEGLGTMSGSRMLPLLEVLLTDAIATQPPRPPATSSRQASSAVAAPAAAADPQSQQAAALARQQQRPVPTAASEPPADAVDAMTGGIRSSRSGSAAQAAGAGTHTTATPNGTCPVPSTVATTATAAAVAATTAAAAAVAATTAAAAGVARPAAVEQAAAGSAGGPPASSMGFSRRRSSSSSSSSTGVSEWAGTDSGAPTCRTTSLADDNLLQQAEGAGAGLEQQVSQGGCAAGAPLESAAKDWAQFPPLSPREQQPHQQTSTSTGISGSYCTADGVDCSSMATSNGSDSSSDAAANGGNSIHDSSSKSTGGGAGMSQCAGPAVAPSSNPAAKALQVQVGEAADCDTGSPDVSPFALDSPVNWSTELPSSTRTTLGELHPYV